VKDWGSVNAVLPIEIDPEIMSGVPVFAGTRVPVETLFDYMIRGSSPSEFLECFPTVRNQDVGRILDYCKREALANASA
jgi:uncharacterized protein (DUF433 family)